MAWRRRARAAVSWVVVAGHLCSAGCALHRSQLRDASPADDELAEQARAALEAAPLPLQRTGQIAIERRGQAFVALGYFQAAPPDGYHAEIVTPFGVTLIEVKRDETGDEIISGSGPLRRLLELGRFPRLLALWLLGDCEDGTVWHGANGVTVDCEATGPERGLTWRIWVDPQDPSRPRGELLKGRRLLADFICNEDGACVLQDLSHGYAVRVLPSSR